MDNQIKKILENLYEIDGELKNMEQDLIKIIQKLIKNKPDTNFDEKFAEELKLEILKKVEKLENKKNKNIINIILMKKLSLSLVGLTIIALIVVTSLNYFNQDNIIALRGGTITQLENNAWGSLKNLGLADTLSTNEEAPAGMGGGGALSADSQKMSIESGRMIYPTQYKFVYTGDDFEIPEAEMEVYKRNKNLSALPFSSSLLNGFGEGLIDLNSFSNTKIQNISLYEDKEYGLMINIYPKEGNVSISENWEKWNQDIVNCLGDNCTNNRLQLNDIPSDDVIIRLANEFVNQHGIGLDFYGEPIVNNAWRKNYEKSNDKENFYIPEYITVIYPLNIDDKTIYNYGGENEGLRVNVNIRKMKASGAYNIIPQNYESSLYATEQDTDKLLQLATNYRAATFRDENTEIVEISLGTPEIVYTKTYIYQNKTSEELVVPALKFPIINVSEDNYYWQDNIIVPIIKELVDEQLSQDEDPTPMPEPILYEEKIDMDIMTDTAIDVDDDE